MPDGATIKSVTTEQGGHYKFENVYPGEYVVRSTRTNAFTLDPTASSFSCKVDWTSDESCSKKQIIVSGYTLKGRIEKPLAGLVLAIYAKSEAVAKEMRSEAVKAAIKDLPSVEGFYALTTKQIPNAVLLFPIIIHIGRFRDI